MFVLVLMALFNGVPSSPEILPFYATLEECEAVKAKADAVYAPIMAANDAVYISVCKQIAEGNTAENL